MMSYVLYGLSGMGGKMLTKTVGRLFSLADDKDFLLDRAGYIFMEHLGRKRAAEVEDKIDIDSNTLNFSVAFCPARETLFVACAELIFRLRLKGLDLKVLLN
ncbi:MAG: hypothetical protein NZ526_06345 [Aquificaceae bacterium]|nr:hypothetical protein [Aquificaceae bacterium]